MKKHLTHSFGIRLKDETYHEIERLLRESPAQPAESVSDYCQRQMERFVWRHKK